MEKERGQKGSECRNVARWKLFFDFYALLATRFSLWQNGTQQMGRRSIPHIEPPMALASQGEDTRGYTLFEAGPHPPSKSSLTLDDGCTQPGGEH